MDPFLRWAGGKTWLVRSINEFLPSNFNNYFEPFLGSGAIFLYLKSNDIIKGNSFLSDQNPNLINSFEILKDHPDVLIERLVKFINSKEEYYKVREKVFPEPIDRAAQFIYLNRTSFNGIYRENLRGEYNVPYGFKKYNTLFDVDNLLEISKILKGIDLRTCDFETITRRVKENDLVFLDPPYSVAHGKNGFVKYNQKIFSWQDQVRLSNVLAKIRDVGALYIMTNAHHKSILDLFRDAGNKNVLTRYCVVGGKNVKREKVEELIYMNF